MAALLVLIDPLIPVPFALTAVILAATVVVLVRHRPLDADEPAGEPREESPAA